MDFVEGHDREQMFISSIEQMVDPEAFVRIIDAFIDALPLEQFDFKNLELNEQGRPPFHPGVLLKLYLYGYQNGVRSCRKLEHACNVNLEVIWLLKGRRPHYKTIANFRKQNALAFRQVFRHFVAMLKDWRLIEGKTIAIDSFKVTAQNSLKNNYNLAKIHRHLDYIDAKIDAYCEELDQADDDDEKEQLHAKIIDQIDKWNLNLQSQENCACQTTGWSILGFPVLLKRLKDAFLSIFDYILVP
ncbi:MAG: transposase [Saprospiraceae bacterium]|nr:transposase [Saprospiraceae bacterium]